MKIPFYACQCPISTGDGWNKQLKAERMMSAEPISVSLIVRSRVKNVRRRRGEWPRRSTASRSVSHRHKGESQKRTRESQRRVAKRRSRPPLHVLSARLISATGRALIPVDGYILPATYSFRCHVRSPKHPLQIRARGAVANSSLLD